MGTRKLVTFNYKCKLRYSLLYLLQPLPPKKTTTTNKQTKRKHAQRKLQKNIVHRESHRKKTRLSNIRACV